MRLERKTDLHAIERVPCVATAPDGNCRSAATCIYLLFSALWVAEERET